MFTGMPREPLLLSGAGILPTYYTNGEILIHKLYTHIGTWSSRITVVFMIYIQSCKNKSQIDFLYIYIYIYIYI